MSGDTARRQDFFHPGGDESVRLVSQERGRQRALSGSPFRVSRARDGGVWTEFHRVGGNYLLRFPGLADFTVSADGREASCRLAPDASMAQIEHLWLNQVAPLARSKQGAMVFHGSCVDIGGRAVAFIGESGRGKSTLAASFASRGHAFLADDGLIVRRIGDAYLACPSHPSIRLWPDSCEALSLRDAADENKSMVRAGNDFSHCGRPLPLTAVYFLEDAHETLAFVRLSARETAMRLLEHSFLLDVEDRDLVATHFDRTTKFASESAGFRLKYPRRFEDLERVRAAIIAQSASPSGEE